jgi:hypothetical protein
MIICFLKELVVPVKKVKTAEPDTYGLTAHKSRTPYIFPFHEFFLRFVSRFFFIVHIPISTHKSFRYPKSSSEEFEPP